MPPLKTYDLFISHAWSYNEDYYRLVNLLNGASNFKWRNYSVPEHDSFGKLTEKQLLAELDGQIKPVNAVLIVAGMYVNHSNWILKEIEIAQSYGKPIIGLKPRGAQVIPKVVQDAAKEMVGWTTESIVEAIRKHAL